MSTSLEMVALFRSELELCKVGPGQTLAVLSTGDVRVDYAQAFMVAANDLGANAFHMNLPPMPPAMRLEVGRSPLESGSPALEALKGADIVIDVVGLLFSHAQNEITGSGTRMLMVREPLDVLQQLFPTEEQRSRIVAAGKLLSNAKELRITSSGGTDIRYGLSQYPVLLEYGYADEPGRWDHFPSGFLLTQGNDGEIEGTVVVMPGDILIAFRKYVQDPIKMVVKGGRVVSIEGEGVDAQLVRNYIESFNDERAYAISHIGWGMNEKAAWHHMAQTRNRDGEVGVNALSFYGNVLFSLGPNTEVGGTNDTKSHLDIPMCGCNLYLDGKAIVSEGKIVPAELKAEGM